ncbi:MAG: sulfide:quinone oxidoreductase [Solirubrobacteraceae bacterium]|jgi:sulfide:quinone oxidoreductase|nr:sulfide:quinone oxidoreductase [Solirubrobacteraceae bacterium]
MRNVVVVGGGVGGLEAALALCSLAEDRVSVTMLATERHLVYRPLSVGVPFGKAQLLRAELAAIAAERGFALRHERLTAVDLDAQTVTTGTGVRDYDALVLAIGATATPAVGGALTFTGPRDIDRLRTALEELASHGGGRVVFAARSMRAWTLPLFELALHTRTWAQEQRLDVRITIVAPEAQPLGILGETELPDLLAASRIEYIAAAPEGTVPGGLWIPAVGQVDGDLVVALPSLTGPEIAGLPGDRLRFVPVDEFCRVRGSQNAYAVGDMAAHRIKQGGLAAQQADVAAAAIACAAGAAVELVPYAPELSALLSTGAAAVPLRGHTEKVFGRHLAPYLSVHSDLIESTS